MQELAGGADLQVTPKGRTRLGGEGCKRGTWSNMFHGWRHSGNGSVCNTLEGQIVKYGQIGKDGTSVIRASSFPECPETWRTPALLCSAHRRGMQSGTVKDCMDRE
jgi:hypothetical protein